MRWMMQLHTHAQHTCAGRRPANRETRLSLCLPRVTHRAPAAARSNGDAPVRVVLHHLRPAGQREACVCVRARLGRATTEACRTSPNEKGQPSCGTTVYIPSQHPRELSFGFCFRKIEVRSMFVDSAWCAQPTPHVAAECLRVRQGRPNQGPTLASIRHPRCLKLAAPPNSKAVGYPHRQSRFQACTSGQRKSRSNNIYIYICTCMYRWGSCTKGITRHVSAHS